MHPTAGTFTVLSAALLLASCGGVPAGPTEHESSTIELDKSEQVRVELRMGAGDLKIDDTATRLAEMDFAYNVPAWKPHVHYSSSGSRGDLRVIQEDTPAAIGGGHNRWDIRLNDKVAMDISVHFGVGKADLDLGNLDLRHVELKMGVGEVELDLRGHPKSSYDVRVEGGVGHARIYLPKTVAIHANASGGIGNIKARGLVSRNGRWINPDQENSPVVVRVDANGGVGEIELIAE
jgi:hypothetical protein